MIRGFTGRSFIRKGTFTGSGIIAPRTSFMVVFDRSMIKRNWKQINEGPLHKAGALARKIERQSIRVDRSKKQRPSKPGRPPKSRAPGQPFRMIRYHVDTFQTNVVIGHIGFGRHQTPMEIHEFGQRVKVRERIIKPGRRRITNAAHRKKVYEKFKRGDIKPSPVSYRERTIKMPERKFALPALAKTSRRLPKLWENSVSTATVRN